MSSLFSLSMFQKDTSPNTIMTVDKKSNNQNYRIALKLPFKHITFYTVYHAVY